MIWLDSDRGFDSDIINVKLMEFNWKEIGLENCLRFDCACCSNLGVEEQSEKHVRGKTNSSLDICIESNWHIILH